MQYFSPKVMAEVTIPQAQSKGRGREHGVTGCNMGVIQVSSFVCNWVYVYYDDIMNDVFILEVELVSFFEQWKDQSQTLTPPHTPLEKSTFDALAVVNNVDGAAPTILETPDSSSSYRICPLQECGKCLWNHLHQYHKRRGDGCEGGLIVDNSNSL